MPFKDPEKRKQAVRDCNARRRLSPCVREAEQRYGRSYYRLPERQAKTWARALMRQYGLTVEQYDQMRAEQKSCAICEQPFGDKKPHLDHNHLTRKVRALLCELCNKGLGQFKDSPEALRKAAEYLERFS